MKLKIIVIVMFVIYSVSSTHVFAGLDTIIQRVGETLRPKETFQNLNKGMTLGNIYTNSYQLAQKEFMTSTIQAISNMTDDLNYTYACNLTINDSSNILLTIDAARNDIQAMAYAVQEATPKGSNEGFVASCAKLIQCASNENINNGRVYGFNTGTAGTFLTDAGFTNCKRFALNAYQRNVRKASSAISLASTNAGTDMYYNGTLEDSPYDILVDIQRIGDVLFGTNEKTPRVLFYTFPNNSMVGFQGLAFDGDSRYTSQANTLQIQNGTITTPPTVPTINNTSSSIPTIGGSSQQINNTNKTGNINTSPVYINTTNTTTNGGIIDNFACIPPTPIQSSPNNATITNVSGGVQNPGTGLQLQNDGTVTTGRVFDITTPQYSPIQGSSNDPLGDGGMLESPEGYEQQAAVINACTAKCNGLPAIDKAMCVAKCMCGTTFTRNGMFGLSVCTVPTTQRDIVHTKTVQSIEEIITEINNVLTNLKNSGELIKHAKPKEFLDTSLSNIKLHQIFAFDVNISFKPILDARPRRMTDAEVENNTDKILQGTYGSIDIGAEKNKYVTFMSVTDGKLGQTRDNTSLESLIRDINIAGQEVTNRYSLLNKTLSDATVASQNAEANDIVRQFIEQNIRFWTYVTESLRKIQETSDALRQKIEKGN